MCHVGACEGRFLIEPSLNGLGQSAEGGRSVHRIKPGRSFLLQFQFSCELQLCPFPFMTLHLVNIYRG